MVAKADTKYAVRGSAGTYLVQVGGTFGEGSCSCPDATYCARTCKHQVALLNGAAEAVEISETK